MRQLVVAGNWKMNKDLSTGLDLVKKLKETLSATQHSCKVIIAPPFPLLYPIGQLLESSNISLAAQDCATHASGAFTGEVSAQMLTSCRCSYVILGHSERRQYYGENSLSLQQKIQQALDNNLSIIFCVGENQQERESEKHFSVVEEQLISALKDLSAEQMNHFILAYEPVWAIGTGLTATPSQAQEMHRFIRSVVEKQWGETTAQEITILYGGSCNPTNASELFSCPDVDGGLIGGAALDAEKFAAIIKAR
ncbi:MAG: triose-phosphate isomerase [Porphyromonas sp.]|nr:triose-phosphate isomerase [Porphyromonas sp.]